MPDKSITGHSPTLPFKIIYSEWHIIEDEEVMEEELENIGPVEDGIQDVVIDVTGDNYAAIELLINFVNTVQVEWMVGQVLRLSGGGLKRQRSFQMAPIKPTPPLRHWLDGMDLDTPGAMRAWREMEDRGSYPGQGHRYVEGLGDSTVSAHPAWFDNPPTDDRRELLEGAAVATGLNILRRVPSLRLTLPGWPVRKSGQSPVPPDFYTRTSQDTNTDYSKMNGYSMLEWKNRLTRKLKSHYMYRMSVVKMANQQIEPYPAWTEGDLPTTIKPGIYGNYSTFVGTGPPLYGSYTQTPNTTGEYEPASGLPTMKPNMNLYELHVEDVGFFSNLTEWASATDSVRETTRGVGAKNIVYIFTADWIGGVMTPFPETQHYLDYDYRAGVDSNNENNVTDLSKAVYNARAGNCLLMEKVPYDATTDLNLPIDIVNLFNGTQKWTYITHYYTVWNFKFTNFAEQPYVIEFMVFKFKADISAMTYERAALAVIDRQRHKFQDYIDGVSSQPADIDVLYRKRMIIGGNNVIRNIGNANQATNKNGSNVLVWKYVQKRKYVIKRPIVKEWDEDFGEVKAYNTYYEFQDGQYIRMQAWPMTPLVILGPTTNVTLETYSDTLANPNVNLPTLKNDTSTPVVNRNMTYNGATLMQAVDVIIDKKSHFKLDEPLN